MLKDKIKNEKTYWNANSIKNLRKTLKMSQSDFSNELGIRQQTVSEWETGAYLPRGGSITLLNMIAKNIQANLLEKNDNKSKEQIFEDSFGKEVRNKKLKPIKKIAHIYYSNVSSSNNGQMLPI